LKETEVTLYDVRIENVKVDFDRPMITMIFNKLLPRCRWYCWCCWLCWQSQCSLEMQKCVLFTLRTRQNNQRR